MSVTVQIKDSISGEWRNAPKSTRVRFSYDGRWSLGLPDSWIEICATEQGDYIEVRGEFALSLGAIAGNTVVISPDVLQGGALELQKLRRHEIELVQKVNEAQDAFHERARKAAKGKTIPPEPYDEAADIAAVTEGGGGWVEKK